MCQLSILSSATDKQGGATEKDYKFLNLVQQKNQIIVVLSEA
jgi:hypothetical protein